MKRMLSLEMYTDTLL